MVRRRAVWPALLAAVTIWIAASAAVFGADSRPQWQYGLSGSYLRGDYGRDTTTEIYYIAATVKRYLDWGDLTLTVPYLDISEGATFIDGAEPLAGARGGSGLGDIVLKGRYYAVAQDGPLPFIDLVAGVKLPTADKDKGLGTGEADFTFMAEFARKVEQTPWIVLGELGYTFVGEPPGYDVDNRWLYSIGLAYELDAKTTLSGYLDGRTAIFDGNDDPLSILLIGQYKLRPDLHLDGMVEFGLNDGAPDFGITFGVRKRM